MASDIQVVDVSISMAYDMSIESGEPIAIPISTYKDDRGYSFMNLLHGVMSQNGQINYSYTHDGVIKAWHRHQKQTDFWICVSGDIKVGVSNNKQSWHAHIGEQNHKIIIIPPGLWHGLLTKSSGASLLYYVTVAYNDTYPDEERMPYDGIKDFVW